MFLSKRTLVAAAAAVAMSLAGISGAHAVTAKAKGAKIVDPTVQRTHMHKHGHKHGAMHASMHKGGHKHMSMHKHGHKHGHKHMSMHGYVAAPAAKPAAKTAVKAKGPGSCGTYMYWKAGKCNDARAPKKV